MGSWNYPYTTTLIPLINAIAAGNVVLIKPSEMSPQSSAVMKSIIDSLDPRVFACIEGGPEVAVAVLDMRWDLIVFTGSPQKGKLVAAAAAKNLTPVVLELGGKNPVIIDADAAMDNAVKRIVQGRYMNAGQLCISPDLALVHSSRLDEFLNGVKRTITEFFGQDPKRSSDYSRIVNEFHTRRIAKMLEGHGGTVVCGGEVDIENRYIAPTVLLRPNKNSPVADEEVFGPILSVFTFDSFDECIEIINSREKPLALYYFGKNKQHMNMLKTLTSSGSITWNDCVVHAVCHDLPFGGVGNSGIGLIAGKEGFRAMSHSKAVLERGSNNSYPSSLRFPPYTPGNQKIFLKMMHILSFNVGIAKRILRKTLIIVLIAVLGYKGYLNPLIRQLIRILYAILSFTTKRS
jgi:aldehyde dehydrogenase (NAD+)